MILKQLDIHHLRNIDSARIELHPRYNFFIGANGSGKSSVLESIYLLATGHSFRIREISPLISYEHDSLTLFARGLNEDTLSIMKSSHGPTIVKHNHQQLYSASELARIMPCQMLYQDLFQIMDAGPAIRRSVMDWGLFHVKQSFHQLWRNYLKVLKQRSALLKQRANRKAFEPWDNQLVDLANQIHEHRESLFANLQTQFYALLPTLSAVECKLSYEKGWDKRGSGRTLQEVLHDQFDSDMHRQYTQSGPHHADLIFSNEHASKAKQSLSRGQQKVVLIAIKLALAQLIQRPCVYLFDDVAAELDSTHLNQLFTALEKIEGQYFFTLLSDELIQNKMPNKSHRFKLNQGRIDPF